MPLVETLLPVVEIAQESGFADWHISLGFSIALSVLVRPSLGGKTRSTVELCSYFVTEVNFVQVCRYLHRKDSKPRYLLETMSGNKEMESETKLKKRRMEEI